MLKLGLANKRLQQIQLRLLIQCTVLKRVSLAAHRIELVLVGPMLTERLKPSL